MADPKGLSTRPCTVRNCAGTYHLYETLVQDHTKHQMYRYECNSNVRHRAFVLSNVGRVVKESVSRWDRTSRLLPKSVGSING